MTAKQPPNVQEKKNSSNDLEWLLNPELSKERRAFVQCTPEALAVLLESLRASKDEKLKVRVAEILLKASGLI